MGKEPMEIDKPLSHSQSTQIDEGLYSRQLYVLGHEAMKRMAHSNVLLLGLKGLGVEIAKNLILAGIKSLTIYDPTPTSINDLSAQFFLTEKDIGKPRAQASLSRLTELNNYVKVEEYHGALDEAFLKQFSTVIATDQPHDVLVKLNQSTHANNIPFIAAETPGVFARIFCDFGKEFTVLDTNGEQPQSVLVSHVSNDNPVIVTVSDEHRIPFEDGDTVILNEISGMEEINGRQGKVKILSKFTFTVEVDGTAFGTYKNNGIATQVKLPSIMNFKSYEEALKEPEFVTTDWAKFERPSQIHLGWQAIAAFQQKHKAFPAARNAEHLKEVLATCDQLNQQSTSKLEKVDDKLIAILVNSAQAEIAPMTTFIGGVAAQEVLKGVSGKFTPIKQFMYFDATEILPSEELPASEFQPIGSRHDAQIAVLGQTLQKQIQQLRYFLVGAGAIGCEVLKVWAMMGLGSGPDGMIHVTDMDSIEKSNLNRQFLFRPWDVEKLKSQTAANAIKNMNPAVNITAYANRVGPENESIFGKKFYDTLFGVCNALDNVEARMYMDSQCILYKKPLLESGTLGTKGNTQVIVPDLTESYASSRDPPEKGIPICTLHHFPNQIEHTIQWARDIFEGIYKNNPENANAYLDNPNFIESMEKQAGSSKVEVATSVKSLLHDDKPKSFVDCVAWARLKFEEYFNNNIQQLLYNFPVDMITSTGAPFWSGPKRAPKPLKFDVNDQSHLDFVLAAANLRAFNFGIPAERNASVVQKALGGIKVPEFQPKKGIKIAANDNEAKENAEKKPEEDDEQLYKQLIASLPDRSSFGAWRMSPISFEKDDDTNFHIDFITATANLRAANYSIAPADRHKCKGIAGKIIPAMVTTTAVVSGLVCLELLKLVQKRKLEDYRNGFVNLALPLFAFSEPIKPPSTKVREGFTWTLWDRFDVQGDITLKEFIQHFKDKYQLEVTMISSGVSMLYSFFMAKDKVADRMNKKMTEIINSVAKTPIPPNKDSVTMEICCSRLEDDEEADVPYVNYIIKPSSV